MYSNLYHETAKDEGVSKLNCQSPVKKFSVQAQLPSKFYNERLATPRLRCAIFVDEARALRYKRPLGRHRSDKCTTETEVLISALSSGIYQKPWPSRKTAGVEELVKYMSSVPCYLQRIEKVENVQEKALNYGVIDWRRLENWTSSQKTDQKNVVFSSINNPESSYLLVNQSCSYSGPSSSNSLTQGKKTSSLDSHQVQPVEEKSRFMSDPSNSRASPISRSLRSNHENCHKSKHEYRTSLHFEALNSTKDDESNHCWRPNSTHDGRFSVGQLERNFLEHEHVLDPLQESSSIVRNKTVLPMHNDRKRMEVHKSSQKSSDQGNVSRDIQLPGPVSAMFQSDKSNISAAVLSTTKGVTSPKYMTNKEGIQIGKSSSNFMVSIDEKSGNQKVESISGGKKQPLFKHPSVASLKWLNRSSSLKVMSTSHQHKYSSVLDVSDDKGRSNSKDRRSPLRRILDPLLKPKYDGNSRATASSLINCSQEQLNNNSLSTGKESSSINTMNRLSDISNCHLNSQVPITPHGFLQNEGYGVPMRQALVKLAWKNAQPLFMFSTNDNNVLVASMRRTGGKDDSGAVYTIVTAQESKKKGGIWTGQSKTRKPNLLYDVVGYMEVSCSKMSSFDSKNLEISRQFVLVGEKLLTCEESTNSVHNSELAAIVVKAPYQKLKGSNSNTHVESLQIEKYPEYSRMCTIAAILPSGVHGFSDTGNPSTIIERWKSGGSCDCGGWDEGCRLTVLTDRFRKTTITGSVAERRRTKGIHHIELFIQGRKGENKYAFSMIAFKEGLYTIEFGSSITSLQAFAICISALHSISSIDVMDNYPRWNSMQRNGGLTGYEPHHPPFSPVGRS